MGTSQQYLLKPLHMASKTKNPVKRSREYLDSDSEEEYESTVRAWSRFLVVEGADADKPLSKLSPFLVQKFFEAMYKC